jgi:hypothetical protein
LIFKYYVVKSEDGFAASAVDLRSKSDVLSARQVPLRLTGIARRAPSGFACAKKFAFLNLTPDGTAFLVAAFTDDSPFQNFLFC